MVSFVRHMAIIILFVGGSLSSLIYNSKHGIYYSNEADHGDIRDGGIMLSAPKSVTWIGDAWILPPRERLFGPLEIRDFFNHHSVLVIGDSEVSRIHYGTLVEILLDSSVHPSKNVLSNSTLLHRKYVADGSNCTFQQGICRSFNNQQFDFVQLECFADVQHFLKETNLGGYNAIVIATGRLETAVSFQRARCETATTREFPRGSFERMNQLMEDLKHIKVPVIWRNGAFSRDTQHKFVQLMDQRVEERLLRTNVRFIDYASSIHKRAYHRLAPERALLFIQLLMNVLTVVYHS